MFKLWKWGVSEIRWFQSLQSKAREVDEAMALTDADVNIAVAKKQGWMQGTDGYWIRPFSDGRDIISWKIPLYCTDIKMSWRLLEELCVKFGNVCLQYDPTMFNGGWGVVICGHLAAEAETAPRAIAIAFTTWEGI